MANQSTDTDSMVAAYLARHGATKVAVGQTALGRRLDIRNRPQDTRGTMVADSGDTMRGQWCEDAPCCGCCDPRIGLARGMIR